MMNIYRTEETIHHTLKPYWQLKADDEVLSFNRNGHVVSLVPAFVAARGYYQAVADQDGESESLVRPRT